MLNVTYRYLCNIENTDMMLLWPQNQLPLQMNMEGLKDLKEDEIKFGEVYIYYCIYVHYRVQMFLLLLLWLQKQYKLPLQINMAGVKDFIEDEIKLGEDSNDHLSSTVCIEPMVIEIEEDLNDHPFCVANVTQEEIKVEEDPYDKLSSDTYVNKEEVKIEEDPNDLPFCLANINQEEVKVEEDPSNQLSSAAFVKQDAKER
jgi:hypothetical protein